MAWFSKQKKMKARDVPSGPVPAAKGENVWHHCDACGEVVPTQDFEKSWNVCAACGQHEALPVRRRFELICDPGSFQELDGELTPQEVAVADASPRFWRISSDMREANPPPPST